MTFKRELNLFELLDKKSFFLFGPRSTGKSSLIKKQLLKNHDVVAIDLLEAQIQRRLTIEPSLLESIIDARNRKTSGQVVSIDEIQKIPALLDEVHRLIEDRKFRFLLTGSSARKLKAQGVNLLGGRAWIAHLFPLTTSEIGEVELERYLRYGGLPHIYESPDPDEELNAYVLTYINEEIKQEGLVKKIPAFTHFLQLAAQTNGQLLNFAEISSDVGVSAPTIKEYYSILEDTLLGNILEPWQKSKKRKAINTSKFYFFDTGVVHTLNEVKSIDRKSDLFGKSFEHFIYMELRAYISYRRIKEKLTFWRSEGQHEVDFVIGNQIAIEVKSAEKIDSKDFKGLRVLQEETIIKDYFIVSQDTIETQQHGVRCLHWKTFLKELWSDKIIN